MYSISAGDSRKLIGTSTRPKPLTPKNEVSSRPAFCDRIATRSPAADAPLVEAGGLGPGQLPHPAVGDVAEPAAGGVGLVDDADAVAVDERGPVEVPADGERSAHGPPVGP